MSIFNRLFGSKKNNDEPGENQPKQPWNPLHENQERKINQIPDTNQTDPPIKPEPEIKKQHKETAPESKTEIPQSGIPWRTFPIFISSTFADMQAERSILP
jgi:hypothetical protein